MKKYLLVIAMVIWFGISAASVYAAVKSTFIRLPEGATAWVYGDAIDKEKMNIVKFTDGRITCYSAITKVGANVVNTSISCVK